MGTDTASPIRLRRLELGLTAEQLAAQAGLASATVYRAERSEAKTRERALVAIAGVLGVETVALHGIHRARPLDPCGESTRLRDAPDNDQAADASSARESASAA